MKSTPKVSVLLLTYNRAHVLPKTIESILNQTYRDFELIVCDDCSTDDTEQVIEQYAAKDSRVYYNRNPENVKMPSNINMGITKARGQYIADLHDGDIYDSTLLEKWVQALDACPKAAFVFNAYRVLDEQWNESCICREDLDSCFPGSVLLDEFFRRWRFDSPVFGMVMARSSVYQELLPFDERFRLFADIDMWMRMAADHWVAYVNEPLMSLASKKTLPRLVDNQMWRTQKIVEQIFLEGRMRYYANRPLRRFLEVLRHGFFVCCIRVYLALICLKHALGIHRSLFSR